MSSRPSLNYRKIVFSNELKMCVRESWAFWVAKAVFVEVRRELFLSAGIEHSMQTYHQPPKGGLLKRTSVKERRGGGNLTGWLLSLCDTPSVTSCLIELVGPSVVHGFIVTLQ